MAKPNLTNGFMTAKPVTAAAEALSEEKKVNPEFSSRVRKKLSKTPTTIRLPESLQAEAKQCAEELGATFNSFVVFAIERAVKDFYKKK